jgi:hypothetical protein
MITGIAVATALPATAQRDSSTQRQSPATSMPQRPGLAPAEVAGGGSLDSILKGVHVTESATVLMCFTKSGSQNYYAPVFNADAGSGSAAMLGAVLGMGMTAQGFPESVSFRVNLREADQASRRACALVMGADFQSAQYACMKAVSIGRGVTP